MKFGCVIPARYGSTRLPGKPLADIAGKPMIERVYARVSQATKTVCTIVATDDNRVYSAVQQFGGTVMMTDPNHPYRDGSISRGCESLYRLGCCYQCPR